MHRLLFISWQIIFFESLLPSPTVLGIAAVTLAGWFKNGVSGGFSFPVFSRWPSANVLIGLELPGERTATSSSGTDGSSSCSGVECLLKDLLGFLQGEKVDLCSHCVVGVQGAFWSHMIHLPFWWGWCCFSLCICGGFYTGVDSRWFHIWSSSWVFLISVLQSCCSGLNQKQASKENRKSYQNLQSLVIIKISI